MQAATPEYESVSRPERVIPDHGAGYMVRATWCGLHGAGYSVGRSGISVRIPVAISNEISRKGMTQDPRVKFGMTQCLTDGFAKPMGTERYWGYILTNAHDTVLYIGVTGDIGRRVCEHEAGAVKGFSKQYNLTKLVHLKAFGEVRGALYREKQLKNWRRA